MLNREIMVAYDDISACGSKAKEELEKLCTERDMEWHYSGVKPEDVGTYLEICRGVIARWHTTDKFKVGDKVYVTDPSSMFEYCIRATVTEVSTDGWGYHLRAFLQDLPGIFMFNMWDKDLIPRTSKANRRNRGG